MLKFDHLCDLDVDVGDVSSLGDGPLGERRVVWILGGCFSGPAIRGEIINGADWQIVRRDGAIDLDARYALKTDDGAIIQVNSQGLRHGPPEVLARLASGEDIDPSHYYFRALMRFETGHDRYDWLNRTLAVGTGDRKARQVRLKVWRIL